MSDKKLTVAELLARAGRDNQGDKGEEAPRRRRRNLEEGGISVAELTGSIPAVKEKPVESKHSSVPIDGPEPESEAVEPEPEAEEAPQTPGTDQTVVLDKVATELPAAPAPAPENTGELTAVGEDTDADAGADAIADEDDEDDEAGVAGGVDKQQLDEGDEKTSVTGVILMTAIGVVLGVVVFKGFEMLWENFSRPIVAGLAILVTLGMVGVVKALRTANDGLSMFLATLVGLVMTFGPLAVVLL